MFCGLCSSRAKKCSVSCRVSVILPTDSVFRVRLSVIHKRNAVVPVSLFVTLLTNSVSYPLSVLILKNVVVFCASILKGSWWIQCLMLRYPCDTAVTVFNPLYQLCWWHSVCQFRYWEISLIRVSVRLLTGTAFHFSLSVPLLICT